MSAEQGEGLGAEPSGSGITTADAEGKLGTGMSVWCGRYGGSCVLVVAMCSHVHHYALFGTPNRPQAYSLFGRARGVYCSWVTQPPMPWIAYVVC